MTSTGFAPSSLHSSISTFECHTHLSNFNKQLMDRTRNIRQHLEETISVHTCFCDFKYSLELLSFGPSLKCCDSPYSWLVWFMTYNSFTLLFLKSLEKMNWKHTSETKGSWKREWVLWYCTAFLNIFWLICLCKQIWYRKTYSNIRRNVKYCIKESILTYYVFI